MGRCAPTRNERFWYSFTIAARMTDSFHPPSPISPENDITAGTGNHSVLDTGFSWLVQGFALCTTGILFWMGWVIFRQAIPAIQQFGLGFLWGQDWDIGYLAFGALPYIYGTVVSSAIALLIAIPVGLAVALVTSENFLPSWVRSPLSFVVELIAAIPSVIIGLWGIFVLLPFLLPIETWLNQQFGWIPLFSTEPFGPGLLPAGIILAIMILPTMAAISRDVLLAIPGELRSASVALGATRWETIFRVMLPSGAPGILGAATLALGRAIGETMAVVMVIGNSPVLSLSILDPASTIPSVLATQFAEALDPLHIGALMYLALLLFVLTLAINVAAVLMVRAIRAQGRINPFSG
jgi:phosphate transport system permease protein